MLVILPACELLLLAPTNVIASPSASVSLLSKVAISTFAPLVAYRRIVSVAATGGVLISWLGDNVALLPWKFRLPV